MKEQTLYLIRGISGAGKTTFANVLKEFGVVDEVFENDMFRVKDGVYVFDPKDTDRVVMECQKATKVALDQGKSVAVSNAFITYKELDPYMRYAKSKGIKLHKIIMNQGFKSVNGTPLDKVFWMKRAFEF